MDRIWRDLTSIRFGLRPRQLLVRSTRGSRGSSNGEVEVAVNLLGLFQGGETSREDRVR